MYSLKPVIPGKCQLQASKSRCYHCRKQFRKYTPAASSLNIPHHETRIKYMYQRYLSVNITTFCLQILLNRNRNAIATENTGSFRINFKSRSICKGNNFHKSLVFSAGLGQENAAQIYPPKHPGPPRGIQRSWRLQSAFKLSGMRPSNASPNHDRIPPLISIPFCK